LEVSLYLLNTIPAAIWKHQGDRCLRASFRDLQTMLTYELLSLKKQKMLNQSGFWVDREVYSTNRRRYEDYLSRRGRLSTGLKPIQG
jgi:hypothetical protein